MLSYQSNPYYNYEKIIYVAHELDESKHGSVEIRTVSNITPSSSIRPSIYSRYLCRIHNEELYTISGRQVFAMDGYLFQLLDDNSIQEIRNKNLFYFYAYAIALGKLEEDVQTYSPALRNTINSLINEVESAKSYAEHSTLNEILSQTHHLLILMEKEPGKLKAALDKYQELIKSVEKKVDLKITGRNILGIMLGLSLLMTVVILAVVLPFSLPVAIITTTLFCVPLAAFGGSFFATGSKYQSLAHKMQDVNTFPALIDLSMGHS